MLQQKPGVAIVLYPGGAAEALVTEQGKYKLVSAARAYSVSWERAVLKQKVCLR
jgi:hypothetical protein